MRMSLLAGLLGLGAAAACSVNTDLPPDDVNPQVEFTSPQNGSTVSGGVSIEVNASDNYSVEVVRILIDGSLKGTYYTRPYQFLWNTFLLPNNTVHTLVAEAVDPSNNIGRATISVSVFNEPRQ